MNSSARWLCLLLAGLCFLVGTLLGFDVLIHGTHVLGWIAAGALFLTAAHVPPGTP